MGVTDIKDIFTKFQPVLLIFLSMGILGGNIFAFLTSLPTIVELFNWLYGRFFHKASNEYFSIKIHERGTRDSNDFYRFLTYLITNKSLIRSCNDIECLECIELETCFEFDGFYVEKKQPILKPIAKSTISFETDDFSVKIEIGESEDEKKKKASFYIVSSPYEEEFNAFLKYLEEFQEEYYRHRYGRPKKGTSMMNYDGEWEGNIVTVKKTFDNIFLEKVVRDTLIRQIRTFIDSKDEYERKGFAHKIGYLFYGVPGNGKSSTIIALGNEFKRDIYRIDADIADPKSFVRQIREIPDNSIVIIEDVDTYDIAQNREVEEEKPVEGILGKSHAKSNLGVLLSVLDGYYYLNGCIIIMTTNHREKLDPALIRPGRIDHEVEFKNASREQIRDMIKFFYDRDFENLDELNVEISVAKFINTLVLGNLNDFDAVCEHLRAHKRSNVSFVGTSSQQTNIVADE